MRSFKIAMSLYLEFLTHIINCFFQINYPVNVFLPVSKFIESLDVCVCKVGTVTGYTTSQHVSPNK